MSGPAVDDALLDELLAIALDAATDAGRFLVDDRPRDLTVAATKSSPTDVVTAMDTAAERRIAARIAAARPDDAFLGEEGTSGGAGADAGVRWVVDPIDGTVNYLHAIPGWSVSVAAEVDGSVVVGVVVNPVLGEVFAAVLGRGATLDGEPIAVSAETDLSRSLVATGFGYDPVRRSEQAAVVREVLPRVADIRRLGAASLDLCAVACGRVDGYYEVGLKPWDLAAGGLVAVEAGARVEGLGGAAAGESMVLAAGPALFGPLHDLIRAAGA